MSCPPSRHFRNHTNLTSSLSSHAALWSNLPACQGRQHQGGIHPLQGGLVGCRRVGHLSRRLGPAGLWCRRSHQRYRHSELQGRRLSGRSNLHGHFSSGGESFPASETGGVPRSVKAETLTAACSISPRSSPSDDLSTQSVSLSRRSCSRQLARHCSSPGGGRGPTPSTERIVRYLLHARLERVSKGETRRLALEVRTSHARTVNGFL